VTLTTVGSTTYKLYLRMIIVTNGIACKLTYYIDPSTRWSLQHIIPGHALKSIIMNFWLW